MEENVILLLSYPDTDLKLNMLIELISAAKTAKLPIVLATHYPVPVYIQESVDYFIYDSKDLPSETFELFYHHDCGDIFVKTRSDQPYHALSCMSSIKNAATFLRNKFKNIHYFETDTICDFPPYIKLMSELLKTYSFVGQKYEVPKQELKGIVGNFFSFRSVWYDEHIPEISSWEQYARLGKNGGDYLMAENWLWHFFESKGYMYRCHFLTPEELKGQTIYGDIKTLGDKEPGLVVRVAETTQGNLIAFAYLYCPQDRNLNITFNGNKVLLHGGNIYWQTFDKGTYLSVKSEHQSFEEKLNGTYLDTYFKFDDDRIKCATYL